MKTKMIANKGVRTFCVGVFMATLINSLTVFATGGASGNGNGDLAFSKIKQSDPSLSPFEVIVKAFEESANNRIDLKWETSPHDKTWQYAVMLDSRKSLLYNTYYYDNYSHGDKQFIEELDEGGYITLNRRRRGVLVNNKTELPSVSIIVSGNDTVWKGPSKLKTVPNGFSIKTKPDNNGSQWEIRQYNENILIFVQLPNAENYCINKNSSVANRPLHGYCLVGYMEKEEGQ